MTLAFLAPADSTRAEGPAARELKQRGNAVPRPAFRPSPKGQEKPARSVPQPKRPVSKTPDRRSNPASACLLNLNRIAVASPAPQPEAADPACRIPQPVTLKSTKGPFPVSFASGLTLDCSFALKTADFVANILQPLARHHVGAPISQLRSGEGFVCRRRNNAKSGKLSEHAFGGALDIVGFDFAGKSRLDIGPPRLMNPEQAAFFKAARLASCGTFTTVLGPGTNAAHARHLHLDLARSKGRKNPYRICE